MEAEKNYIPLFLGEISQYIGHKDKLKNKNVIGFSHGIVWKLYLTSQLLENGFGFLSSEEVN